MSLFLSNQVLVYLFSQTLLLGLNLYAVIATIGILRAWNFESTSQSQYRLEKRTYLIILIIFFSLVFKVALIPYFAYTIDSLSDIVPGAMCAAGVIGANSYGNPLLFIKIILLFFIGIWLVINTLDQREKTYPYLRVKFWFYLLIFALFVIEYGVDLLYFSNISLEESVQCCSVIFGFSGENTLPLGLDPTMLTVLFYLLFVLLIIFTYQRQAFILALLSLFWLFIGYFSLVHIFGIYIYALPTHKCPFCMLQSEYFSIGYLLWGVLFLGVFFGIVNAFLKLFIDKEIPSLYRYSRIFNTTFVILCSLYPLLYYLKNGVWL